MTGECFICGRYGYVERHHLFGGANRKHSEEDGLVVDLCPGCHRNDPHAAHKCGATAESLHKYGEELWLMKNGGTEDDFRKRYGKNYLDAGELADIYGKIEHRRV